MDAMKAIESMEFMEPIEIHDPMEIDGSPKKSMEAHLLGFPCQSEGGARTAYFIPARMCSGGIAVFPLSLSFSSFSMSF